MCSGLQATVPTIPKRCTPCGLPYSMMRLTVWLCGDCASIRTLGMFHFSAARPQAQCYSQGQTDIQGEIKMAMTPGDEKWQVNNTRNNSTFCCDREQDSQKPDLGQALSSVSPSIKSAGTRITKGFSALGFFGFLSYTHISYTHTHVYILLTIFSIYRLQALIPPPISCASDITPSAGLLYD